MWWQLLTVFVVGMAAGFGLTEVSYRQGRRHERERWEREKRWDEVDAAIIERRWADALNLVRDETPKES